MFHLFRICSTEVDTPLYPAIIQIYFHHLLLWFRMTKHGSRKDNPNHHSTKRSAELATNIGNLSNIISTKFEELSKELLNKVSSIVNRVKLLEKRKNGKDRIWEKIGEIASEVQSEVTLIREEIQEQTRRLHKVLNIIMMGVPETKTSTQRQRW